MTTPIFQSASINGSLLKLTYSEALDIDHQPNLASFVITVNGGSRQVLNVSEIGATVSLTLSAPVMSTDVVTVAYNDLSAGNDAFAIQGVSGNDAASLTNQSVTNNTGTASSSPVIVAASFSEPTSGSSTISLTFNQPMQVPQASFGAAPTFLKNGDTTINIVGTPTVSGRVVTFNTDTLLAAGDFVLQNYMGSLTNQYNGSGYLRATGGQWFWGNVAIGGSGNTSLSVDGLKRDYYIFGNGGNDTLTGEWSSQLTGGAGSDTLIPGGGTGKIFLVDGAVPASDTVYIDDDDHQSTPGWTTTVYGFDTTGTVTNDKLSLPSDIIAANTAQVNGNDVGAVRSHSIAGGIVTFYSADSVATPLLINSANLKDAARYLYTNITTAGTAAGFAVDLDGNGSVDSLAVFEQYGLDGFSNSTLVVLGGVVGATLGNTAGQNVVQLVDTTGPNLTWLGLNSNGLFYHYNEPIVKPSASPAGITVQQGHGSTLTPMNITGASVTANALTLTISTTLQPGDYVLQTIDHTLSRSDGLTDRHGNVGSSGDFEAIAVAGSNTIVDLSGRLGSFAIAALDGSNDTLIGSGGDDIIVMGGVGRSSVAINFFGNNLLIGNGGDDSLYASAGNDTVYGGEGNDKLEGDAGADYLDGGAGADNFIFYQGYSPLTVFADTGTAGLNTGDTFNFANGTDVIGGGFTVGGANGDQIRFYNDSPESYFGNLMSTTPANGKVTDQCYFTIGGRYVGNTFTVDTAAGTDTLVVYDGDPTAGITQTGFIISGVAPGQLTKSGANLYLTSSATASDLTAPVLIYSAPADNVSAVAVSSNLTLTFNEAVKVGTGSLVLTDTNNAANTRTIAVTDSAQVSISGATVTVNPTADLVGGAHYAVTMASGVIKDLAGNDFAGITSNTTLDFTTVASGSSYSLTATPTAVNEGSTVTFNVSTTGVAANTVLYYTLSGAGITTADIGGAALTGTTSVDATGSASFTVSLTADQLTEGGETLTATVQGQSASVTVNDTSTTVTNPLKTKYFVLSTSTGANFTDFDLAYGSVSLTGEQVTFVGSSAVDAVFVRPGVTVDFTLSGSGADKIYLGGSLAHYTQSITGSVMTLQRGSGVTLESVSFIKSTSAASSDSVIFADGTLNSLDLYNNLKSGTALPALSTTETSLAPLAPALAGSVLNASIKAFALNAGGDTFAPAKPGVAMTVVGGLGVDTVYVARGGVEDCTLLGGSQDLIYFTGNWGDYTKVISGSVVTFSRTVDGYGESVKVVGSGTTSLNDQLVFADGAVRSADAKAALVISLTVALSAVSGYDATLVTPGLGLTLNANALNNVSNLEVSSNLVINYNESVTAASGKYIHIVNDGGTGFHGESTTNTLNISVTDTTQVTISGSKVTLNPTADLDLGNNYHITIDAGAFTGVTSRQASAAYDGTNTLHFSTVTPGANALSNAVASQVMNADGTLGSGHLWLDIEGVGSPSSSAGTGLDLSGNNYALVAKDYDAVGGSASTGYDGVKTADFNVAATSFGAGDLLYIDNQSSTVNDVANTNIINRGAPPTTLQFAGTGLGGIVDISLAGTTTTFDTVAQMKLLLGASTSPVISA